MNKKLIALIGILTLVANYNILQTPLVKALEGYIFVFLNNIIPPSLSLFLIRSTALALYFFVILGFAKLSIKLKTSEYKFYGIITLLILPYFTKKLSGLTVETILFGIISFFYVVYPNSYNSLVKLWNRLKKKNTLTKAIVLNTSKAKTTLIESISSKLYIWLLFGIAIIYVLPKNNISLYNTSIMIASAYLVYYAYKKRSKAVLILSLITFLSAAITSFSYLNTSLIHALSSLLLIQIIIKWIENRFDLLKDYYITKLGVVVLLIALTATNISTLSGRWNDQDNQPYLDTISAYNNLVKNSDSKIIYNNNLYKTKSALSHKEVDLENLLDDQYYLAIDTRINDTETQQILELKDNFNTVVTSKNGEVIIFSTLEKNPAALQESWEFYKEMYITDKGQVIDIEENISTSEGQAYAMLRAVILEDKQTFDKVWEYTQNKFQAREGDKLLSWKIQADTEEVTDYTIATDADIDAATALLLASKTWGESYLSDAKILIADIWRKTVFEIDGLYYLGYSDNPFSGEQIILNPSYFSPYAYRMFQTVDDNNWTQLATDSYTVLDQISKRTGSTTLPPNWIGLNTTTKSYESANLSNKNKDDYSFDAFRTYFRVALDYQQFESYEAQTYLEEQSKLITDIFEKQGYLPSILEVNGEPNSDFESVSTNIGLISTWITDQDKEIKANTILFKDYNKTHWGKSKNYYDQNWGWFGLALYNDKFNLNQNFDN